MVKKERLIKKSASLFLSLTILLSAMATVGALAAEEVTEGVTEDYIFYNPFEIYDNLTSSVSTSASVTKSEEGIDVIRLTVTEETTDPSVCFSPSGTVDVKDYDCVAFIVKKKISPVKIKAYFTTTATGEKFSEKMSKRVSYNANTKWQIIVFEMTDLDGWSDMLTGIRLDYFDGRSLTKGSYCDLAGIVLGKDGDSVIKPVSDIFAAVSEPLAHYSDFSNIDVDYFKQATYQSSVYGSRGNIVYDTIGSSKGQTFDPQAMWNYESFAVHKGEKPLNTEDFSYMVIRYKAKIEYNTPQMFEAFFQTGDRYSAKAGCSGTATYTPNGYWQSMIIKFDGRPEWSGALHSLRIDWSNAVPANTYAEFEVSDILFFKNNKKAALYHDVMNNIIFVEAEKKGEEETEVITDDIVLPWDTEIRTQETEETTEETLPEFIETTEETLPEFTETTEEVTEEITEESTEETTEEITQEPVEETTEKKPDKSDPSETTPGEAGSDVDSDTDGGSQAPFVIACVILTMLSAASIVTLIIIRAKTKKEQ